MVYNNGLKAGIEIRQVLLCKSKTTKIDKNGHPYYEVEFVDKTGTVGGKIWGADFPNVEDFGVGDYIFVIGMGNEYNNTTQIIVKRARIAKDTEYIEDDYIPVTTKDIDEQYNLLLGYMDLVKDPKIRELLESFFVDDKDFIMEFKRHSAAEKIHHGFKGGLLQHTVSVTRLCKNFCAMYPELNMDLLLASAMLHDIGKVREISYFPSNSYTDEGKLLGHIYMGCEMVSERIKDIPDFPEKKGREICHCILAHHGKPDFGSPVKPALMEAMALHFADNTDAKMETFIEQVIGAQSDDWLGKNWALDSDVRKATPIVAKTTD